MTESHTHSGEVSEESRPARRYAGFWIRAAAYVLDQLLLMIASQVLTYTALFLLYLLAKSVQSPPPASFGEAFSGIMIQVVNLLASLAVSVPYYIAFHHYRGATPGKQVLGIVVIDEETGEFPSVMQSVGRFFASMLSAILVGAGYLMVAFNREKRGLHDILAGTVSIYREKEHEPEEEPTPAPVVPPVTERGEGPTL